MHRRRGDISRRGFLAFSGATAAAQAPGGVGDRGGAPVYLTDLDRSMPAAALSRKARRFHWRLLDYETDSLQGVMLVAGHGTAAPEVAYPLRRKGWHAISIGLRAMESSGLLLRLKNDSTFSRIEHHPTGPSRRIDDLFWKCAELQEGDEIIFRQLRVQTVPESPDSPGNRCHPAWVAYIKLVPMSEAQVRDFQADRGNPGNRRLFAHNDAWSYTYNFRPTTEEEIRREIEPFRGTDFARLYWEGGSGDQAFYFSKIAGSSYREWMQDHYRVGDRLANESFKALRDKGIDPFHVALRYAHEMGLEFHAAYRPAGFHYPPVEYEEWTAGGLYDKHPEWRCVDRLGRPAPRLSYAFPEVRRWVVSFLGEMAEQPIDGIAMLYNRRPPIVQYEAPLIEGFQRRHGQDPRKRDERDPEWLRYRAECVTQFMADLRTAMDRAGRKHGRRLEISAFVLGSLEENLQNALDLESWIRRGLVDTIVPYSSVPGINSSETSWNDPRDAEPFLRLTRGTSCKLALNLMPRWIGPEDYRARAHRLYDAGIEYLACWDCNARNGYSRSWDVLRRLGHREEIAAWVKRGAPLLDRPGSKLVKLGDWNLDYATPG